jgi:hypothetical protein
MSFTQAYSISGEGYRLIEIRFHLLFFQNLLNHEDQVLERLHGELFINNPEEITFTRHTVADTICIISDYSVYVYVTLPYMLLIYF